MQDLGKILMIPKGDYEGLTTYEFLDVVNHNESSWICKKECRGQEPSDANVEYWQKIGTAVDLQPILNGTTQVGNAKTLDGHGAEYFAKETDLTNYLPLNGGKNITKNLNMVTEGSNMATFSFKNDLHSVQVGIGSDGDFVAWDYTLGEAIWRIKPNGTKTFNGVASGNLPLNNTTFPTVKNAQDTVMAVESTATTNGYSVLRFARNGTNYGSLGFYNENTPVFMPSDFSVRRELLHTGNKPTGTYTGNGSTTLRQIRINGIGSVVYVYGGGYGVYVSPQGGIVHAYNSNEVSSLKNTEAGFSEGVLSTATDKASINANGVTYTYWVL